jgi:hypothetical protein
MIPEGTVKRIEASADDESIGKVFMVIAGGHAGMPNLRAHVLKARLC